MRVSHISYRMSVSLKVELGETQKIKIKNKNIKCYFVPSRAPRHACGKDSQSQIIEKDHQK